MPAKFFSAGKKLAIYLMLYYYTFSNFTSCFIKGSKLFILQGVNFFFNRIAAKFKIDVFNIIFCRVNLKSQNSIFAAKNSIFQGVSPTDA